MKVKTIRIYPSLSVKHIIDHPNSQPTRVGVGQRDTFNMFNFTTWNIDVKDIKGNFGYISSFKETTLTQGSHIIKIQALMRGY